MELLDIIDENNNLTGKAEDRKTIHEKGLWHRQIYCWIMNTKGELLLQKRAATKKQNPNKWALVAGHIEYGEEPVGGMIREIKEEIGVEIPEDYLELLNIEKDDKKFYKPDIPHKCYKYMYFTIANYNIEEYTIQKEELSEIKYMTIEEIEQKKLENDESYVFIKWQNFKDIINILKKRRELLCVKK